MWAVLRGASWPTQIQASGVLLPLSQEDYCICSITRYLRLYPLRSHFQRLPTAGGWSETGVAVPDLHCVMQVIQIASLNPRSRYTVIYPKSHNQEH